jgi:hypothetical protein
MSLALLTAPAEGDTMVFENGIWQPKRPKPTDFGFPYDLEQWKAIGTNGSTWGTSWGNPGGGFYNGYFKKMPNGYVKLIGTVSGTVGTSIIMFTLPAGYRPTVGSLFLPAVISGGIGCINILSTGVVQTVTSVTMGTGSQNPGFVLLDSIQFQAA